MDFASLMKSQIASANSTDKSSNKYLRRGDAEAVREETYAAEQAELEAARLARIDKKRRRDEEEDARKHTQKLKQQRIAEASRELQVSEAAAIEAQRRKKLGLPDLGEEILPENIPADEDVEDDLLRQRLQELGLPRIVFGETHGQRLTRWKAYVDTQKTMSEGPIPTNLELLAEKDMKLPAVVPEDRPARLYLLRQLASYFDLLLSEWETALRRRSKEVKDSSSGKQAYSHYAAALSNLTPLFRKLETNKLSDDILKPIVEIVNLAQAKRYVDANDAYLKLSIGNTAWPIGVTMVGIHERSAREKLNEDGVSAHIMSDESTRKMIQGIKRTLTFAQTRWPPDELGQLMG